MHKIDFTTPIKPENTVLLSKFGAQSNNHTNNFETATDLLKKELLDGYLLSYNEKLDELFKNVLTPGKIIEFIGQYDSSTPICLKLCVTVQLPKCFGGFSAEAFYVSTTGNLYKESIEEYSIKFMQEHSDINEIDVNSVVNRIYYAKIMVPIELVAFLTQLDEFLIDKNVRLLIIDSFSHVLRQLDGLDRFKVINYIFLLLRKLCDKYNLIVILTNFQTSVVKEGVLYTIPSFGDSFYHLINSRIIFNRIGDKFYGKLLKSVVNEEKEVTFVL